MSNSADDLKTQVPPADAPYRNPNLPTAQRVADLVSRMTLAEKAGQMLQLNAKDGVADYILKMHAGSILHTSPARVIEAAELTKQTRLQIPLLVADDAIHGHSFWEGATIFPTQLYMAASWSADLIEQVARAKHFAAYSETQGAATPPRQIFPGARCALGSCHPLSEWPGKALLPSCSATSQLTECPARC